MAVEFYKKSNCCHYRIFSPTTWHSIDFHHNLSDPAAWQIKAVETALCLRKNTGKSCAVDDWT